MESKIKNYLENVEGFMDYTRKRTRGVSEDVDETNRPNATVSNSSNTTQHIFNDTLNKLMMFSDYYMDSISNTHKDYKGKEIISSPSSGTASHASGFSFLKLLASVENQSLKKKTSDMNMGRQEMVATIANSDEAVVQPKLLLCGHFELPIVRQKMSGGSNDAGSSMENLIKIND
ncbi:unnamed protein product [Vicia faba]|uniref:Uncharacterized protein n=1 Tax=Vicia faba TaxID=3906 RepID=A0AAV0YRU4_VICFA|nr:unnamed protein product [Vicia faba]